MSDGNVVPDEAHNIKKGGTYLMKGRPTKISQVSKSKTGKHGHAKIVFDGIDVFNGRKYNDVLPGHMRVLAYDLARMDAEVQMIDAKERTCEIMDNDGEIQTFDLPDNEMCNDLIAKYEANEENDGNLIFTVAITIAPIEIKENEYELHSEIASFKSAEDQ